MSHPLASTAELETKLIAIREGKVSHWTVETKLIAFRERKVSHWTGLQSWRPSLSPSGRER